MQFWIALWTVIWFSSLVVFSLLSVLIIIFGARDLVALLANLKARHGEIPRVPCGPFKSPDQ